MSVSSISNTNNNIATQAPQRTAEASETKKGGRDNDGDADDGGAGTVKPAPPSSVNLNGQTVGQLVNVTA